VEHVNGERELYDLENDPDELVNVAIDPALAPLRNAMALRLAALRGCAGSSCRAKPALRLDAARRRCLFNVAVRGADARAIERVEFLVRRRPRRGSPDAPTSFRRLARDVKPDFRRRVRAAGVLPGRRFLLRARVRLDDGRAVTIDEKRRTCR